MLSTFNFVRFLGTCGVMKTTNHGVDMLDLKYGTQKKPHLSKRNASSFFSCWTDQERTLIKSNYKQIQMNESSWNQECFFKKPQTCSYPQRCFQLNKKHSYIKLKLKIINVNEEKKNPLN